MRITSEMIREDLSTNEFCALLRQALRDRSGKTWSVTHGKGTAYGWITIRSPKARSGEFGYMPDADREELASLLGLDRPVHDQGEMISSGSDYRAEYIARAFGETPKVYGQPTWD